MEKVDMRKEIKKIQDAKLEKLNGIVVEVKEEILSDTKKYFEDICGEILKNEELTYDFMRKNFFINILNVNIL